MRGCHYAIPAQVGSVGDRPHPNRDRLLFTEPGVGKSSTHRTPINTEAPLGSFPGGASGLFALS